MAEPRDPSETEDEKRARIMRRLAEIVQGPPPDTSGSAGPVAGGGFEQAIAALGLGLSAEDSEQFTAAVEGGRDPEEAAALFQAMLAGFQQWQRGSRGAPSRDEAAEPDDE